VARTPNYGFEKRRKEMERKAKKEARLQRKRDSRAADELEEGSAPSSAEATPEREVGET
jgi:hypothetical protein